MKPIVWIAPAVALIASALLAVWITPWAWLLFAAVLAWLGWVVWRVGKGKG